MSNNFQRKGIILAAGLGSRLSAEGNDGNCKPLMLVDNITLLIRTIKSLEIAACEQVVIVLGHRAAKIENYIRSEYDGNLPLIFAVNHKYNLQTEFHQNNYQSDSGKGTLRTYGLVLLHHSSCIRSVTPDLQIMALIDREQLRKLMNGV